MLPTIPNLPTDNLYKFMALSGLFIAVLGFGFQHIDEDRRYTKTKVMEVEVEAMKSDSEKLGALLEQLSEPNTEYSERLDNLKEQLTNFRKKFAPMNSPNSQKLYTNAGRAGWLGIILSMSGFSLWYFRVQKLLDEILRIQLSAARIDNLRNNLPLPVSETETVVKTIE